MKLKHLALSLLSASIACVSHSSPISVTGFSAGEYSPQASYGQLRINSLSSYPESFTGITPLTIDISMTDSIDEAVAIVIETAPKSDAGEMLNNYPSAPITSEGIDAYQRLIQKPYNTDAEFKTAVDTYLAKNKYSGVEVGFLNAQAFITQTANNLVIATESQTGPGQDLYLCETERFDFASSIEGQESCAAIELNVSPPNFSYKHTPNGSFQSDKFVYGRSGFSWLGTDDFTLYDGSSLFNVPVLYADSVAINHNRSRLSSASVFDHRSSASDFFVYTESTDPDLIIAFGWLRSSTPESVLYITGRTAYFDKTDTDGTRYLTTTVQDADTWPDPENTLPIKLKSKEGNNSYGFSDSLTTLSYNADPEYVYNGTQLLGLGYYGSDDLQVYTPAIYDRTSEGLTYLAPAAIKHLEASTPEGFIDAVRTAVLNTLPDALAQSYPELPSDLSELSIDPDITPAAFRALVDERTMRIATSGALERYNNGETITVGSVMPDQESFRWSSNELQFVAENILRAPYATYSFSNQQTLESSLSVSATELTAGSNNTADFSIDAKGTFRKLVAKCYFSSTRPRVFFSSDVSGVPVEGAMITDIQSSGSSAQITYESDVETYVDDTVFSLSLTATGGAGEVPVNCSLTAYNGFGGVAGESETTVITVNPGTVISGQFTSPDSELTPDQFRYAYIDDTSGSRYYIYPDDTGSFSINAGAQGDYILTAKADGYVFPCQEINATGSLVDAGNLEFLRGDVTGDGAISSADLWRYYFRIFYPSTDFDMNGDGSVDNSDRSIIQNNQGAVQCDL